MFLFLILTLEQSLEVALHMDSSQLCDEDISYVYFSLSWMCSSCLFMVEFVNLQLPFCRIDELKVFTEEQLLNMALEESSQVCKPCVSYHLVHSC